MKTLQVTRHVVWGDVGERTQAAVWREKLQASVGNISRAAQAMGFSKRYGMKLTAHHGLNAFAAELRRLDRGKSHGRPWPLLGPAVSKKKK